ncbi:hypothetical protein [Actinomadura rubrisoli]|uniref:Uncharacterized protein n=1 Tax=Actinomadura rubrisoli TaxID=2530368 RepID=A0A4R5BKI0_9ACTN|nr:hypothetical protein [Actinomadura rubrisoli]TDD84312.1 hypothetical protein E1298_20130 [Actinomadura rubrisoli]
MTHNDASTRRIARATQALEAYEQTVFPNEPSLLQHDPLYTEAFLSALICDLEHYATGQGITFSGVLSTARSINAEEVAEQTPTRPTAKYG